MASRLKNICACFLKAGVIALQKSPHKTAPCILPTGREAKLAGKYIEKYTNSFAFFVPLSYLCTEIRQNLFFAKIFMHF